MVHSNSIVLTILHVEMLMKNKTKMKRRKYGENRYHDQVVRAVRPAGLRVDMSRGAKERCLPSPTPSPTPTPQSLDVQRDHVAAKADLENWVEDQDQRQARLDAQPLEIA
jgi:hypothetical protein